MKQNREVEHAIQEQAHLNPKSVITKGLTKNMSERNAKQAKIIKSNDTDTLDPTESFYIVGVGASAGGLPAFMQLLERIPSDTGMAFIFVRHLDLHQKSLLTKTLANATSLPVNEATDGTIIKINHIYTMPSENYITIKGRVLHLTSRPKGAGTQYPIDSFFNLLAKYHGKNAIGVILSGTGKDGTLGIKSIKNKGGITFAQDISAQFSDMPQSAINTGNIDYVMPADKIAPALIKIKTITVNEISRSKPEAGNYGTIIALLKKEIGIDFLQYKQSSVNRRIHRRMMLNHLENIKDYSDFLKNKPIEIEALHKDMLIHVTSFFREPEQFKALKN
jgi:two-component system CheB/CheR fusion protein